MIYLVLVKRIHDEKAILKLCYLRQEQAHFLLGLFLRLRTVSCHVEVSAEAGDLVADAVHLLEEKAIVYSVDLFRVATLLVLELFQAAVLHDEVFQVEEL